MKANSFRERNFFEWFFKVFSGTFVILGLGLFLLFGFSVAKLGLTAFLRTEVCLSLPSFHDREQGVLFPDVLRKVLSEMHEPSEWEDAFNLVSWGALRTIKQLWKVDQSKVWVPLSASADEAYKVFRGVMTSSVDLLTKGQHNILERWQNLNILRFSFNEDFFTRADSQEPELAGVLGSLWGSIYTLWIALLVSFPIGVGAGIYLEEFAPRTRFIEWIELYIQNLAAVPSILFGLLGVVLWGHIFGLPRSSALIGGLTLALMLCSMFVVTTRIAFQGVPQPLREAALALGASPIQVVFQQCLPVAFPGILTGTLINIVRAVGESAPLLLVGLVVFVGDVPANISEPTTVLPIQIFLWCRNADPGFQSRTAGAILILLLALIVINGIVALLKHRWKSNHG